MKIPLLVLSLFLVISCGDKNKSEFMDGCTGGNTSEYAHKICSCAFDKMEGQYGNSSQWEAKLRRDSPVAFLNSVKVAVESCQ